MAGSSPSADRTSQKLHLAKVSSITVNTGNIINELSRKIIQSATDEILQCTGTTLDSWISEADPSNGLNSVEDLQCFSEKQQSGKINREERKDLKLTVKVFLNSFEPTILKEAVNQALQELDVTAFESVIVAFPPTGDKLKLKQIQAQWRVLETLVEECKIITIGISDLDTELLIELHDWALIKPSVNQVNIDSCCVIPPEMQAFAKAHDIQLLTHNDPKEILPEEQLNHLLTERFTFPSGAYWMPFWIVRYSALVKCRGVIQNKGYIVTLHRKPTGH